MTPYADARREPVPWGGLLLRLFVVVVPAQVLGVIVGGALVTGLGPADGRLGNLILVAAGLLAGLGVGLLVTPPADRVLAYLLTSAAFGGVVVVALLVVSQLARPTGTPGVPLGSAVTGVLIVVAVQSLLAWALWRARRRP